MPVLTLTAFFRDDDGHGWSEAHNKIDGGSNPPLGPYLDAFDELMKTRRRPLLAGDGFYLGCRASYRTANKRIAAAPRFADLPLQGTQTQGGKPVFMNEASNAILIRMQNAANTATSPTYLRGVWDNVMIAGQLQFTDEQGPQFKTYLTAYENALIAGVYGWYGVDPDQTPRGNVTNYVVDDDGFVTFTVAATNAVAMPTPANPVSVQFSGINNKKSILNRTLVCTVVNATTIKTVQPVAATAFVSAGHFAIPTKGFIPYATVAARRLSNRKTGRPIDVQRGRRSVQTLH